MTSSIGNFAPHAFSDANSENGSVITTTHSSANKIGNVEIHQYFDFLRRWGFTSELLCNPQPCIGTYGKIYRSCNPYIVIKIIEISQEENPQLAVRSALNELSHLHLLNRGNTPHIVEQLDSFVLNSKRIVSVQKYAGPDLFKTYIDRTSPFWRPASLAAIESIAKQVLEALAEMHQMNIFHFDLKPSNISQDVNGQTHILDLGSAARCNEGGVDSIRYSRSYRPPENINGKMTGATGDIWSFACVLFELFTGRAFSWIKDETEETDAKKLMLEIIFQRMLPDDKNIPAFVKSIWEKATLSCENPKKTNQFVDLLVQMLTLNPQLRPHARQLLDHPFFTSETRTDTCFRLTVVEPRPLIMEIIDATGRPLLNVSLMNPKPSCLHINSSFPPYVMQFYGVEGGCLTATCPLTISDGEDIQIDMLYGVPRVLLRTPLN